MMPITNNQFDNATMRELRLEVTNKLHARPNWTLALTFGDLWRISFGGSRVFPLRISIQGNGSILATIETFSKPFWLGYLGSWDAFALISNRILQLVYEQAFPFLNKDLSSYCAGRLILWQAVRFGKQWPEDNKEAEWQDSLIDAASKRLASFPVDSRVLKWQLLLATANGLQSRTPLGNWSSEARVLIDKAIPSRKYARWYCNNYQAMLDGDTAENFDKWSRIIQLEHCQWFTRDSDLQTSMMGDHLI